MTLGFQLDFPDFKGEEMIKVLIMLILKLKWCKCIEVKYNYHKKNKGKKIWINRLRSPITLIGFLLIKLLKKINSIYKKKNSPIMTWIASDADRLTILLMNVQETMSKFSTLTNQSKTKINVLKISSKNNLVKLKNYQLNSHCIKLM